MPELPEVETVRRGLQDLIVGKVIESVDFDNPKSFPNDASTVDSFMLGSEIIAVRRRAKVLMIDLSTKYSLMIHLKMTGQMVYEGASRFGAGHPSDSLIGKLPDRSTRVSIGIAGGDKLFFNDQRKFGWMRLLPTLEIPEVAFMKKVGPEPLEDSFTPDIFLERVKKRLRSSIKAAILDQSVLAGVGNIYADEALWGAKIYPGRVVASLSDEEIKLLYDEIRYVMNKSIDEGGSSNSTYVNAKGERGSYMDFARVFRRQGQPCKRCGSIIEKTRVAARGTHFCPICQLP